MSDFRKDPFTGDWVSIAENRAGRPIEYYQTYKVTEASVCPFCNGNEPETPSAIAEYGENGKPWAVRVVPNKYPAFFSSDSLNHSIAGPYEAMSSMGSHEIIIESSNHVASFGQLSDSEIGFAVQAYKDSVARQREDKNIRHVSLFKNCRYDAGASIEHVHTQLIGLPLVTDETERRLDNICNYQKQHNHSMFDAIIESERKDNARIISETENFIAFCPFASRSPYQISVFSKLNLGHFDQADHEKLVELGLLARSLIKRLELVVPETAYNLIIHLAPFDYQNSFRWFVEILPRITKTAGFEWAAKCWINPVSPETAAHRLASAI